MSALKTLAMTAAMGLSLAACSTSAPADGPRPATPEDDRMEVRVENRGWSDVNVYAVENGMRLRLGTVTSMNTQRLRVPTRAGLFTHNVQLIAVPIGAGQAFVAPVVQVARGQTMEFTIQNHLSISTVSVLNR
jgi:hypothetical protein